MDALESVTCLPFPESSVSATVADAVSHSGGPEHSMRLRRSYIRKEKESTLVHELGHRHLWQLVERLDGVDGHMTLYLVLERVWRTCGARSSPTTGYVANPIGMTDMRMPGPGRAPSGRKSERGCGTSSWS